MELSKAGTPQLAITCFCTIYTKKKKITKGIGSGFLSVSVEVPLGESASLFEEMEIVTKFVEICDESNKRFRKIAIGFLLGISGYAGCESARFARYPNSERF